MRWFPFLQHKPSPLWIVFGHVETVTKYWNIHPSFSKERSFWETQIGFIIFVMGNAHVVVSFSKLNFVNVYLISKYLSFGTFCICVSYPYAHISQRYQAWNEFTGNMEEHQSYTPYNSKVKQDTHITHTFKYTFQSNMQISVSIGVNLLKYFLKWFPFRPFKTSGLVQSPRPQLLALNCVFLFFNYFKKIKGETHIIIIPILFPAFFSTFWVFFWYIFIWFLWFFLLGKGT